MRRRERENAVLPTDAFGTNVSCYRLPSEDGRGRAIHPFDYLASTRNPDLDAALVRFVEAVDIEAVCALIDSVPAEAFGRVLMTEGVRSSHKLLLRRRLEDGFLPVYRRITG